MEAVGQKAQGSMLNVVMLDMIAYMSVPLACKFNEQVVLSAGVYRFHHLPRLASDVGGHRVAANAHLRERQQARCESKTSLHRSQGARGTPSPTLEAPSAKYHISDAAGHHEMPVVDAPEVVLRSVWHPDKVRPQQAERRMRKDPTQVGPGEHHAVVL
eukprot:CAMPEP_0176031854 /NCGR_PEP_ID=MMETSP0120_2-20121206/15713_1 /TAXON_ID=160619 /ORGANISM="Kryptoperidinium foliaceum, Strain CCMP 1326" /LENGTH=157 /DNA_ID=CAMNT_0017365159 /DNA_START=132 /DNA_END=604 /DNA_ORIENTATION=-